ncbi:MAG: pentapeptide repeat-containing protein [Gloeomargaritales cyanobacterium]
MNEPPALPDIRTDDSFENREFKNISVEQIRIVGKEFYRCNFQMCKFQGTTFQDCRFEQCGFADCDLSLVKMLNTGLFDVTFRKSKLVGIDWTKANKHMSFGFFDCNLCNSTFFGLNLSKTNLIDCQLGNVDFTEANLTRCICKGSDFREARFNNTDLSYANFSDAQNYMINPNSNKLKKTRFSLPGAVSLYCPVWILF